MYAKSKIFCMQKSFFEYFKIERLIKKFVGEDKMKFAKNELLKEDPSFLFNYEKKRIEVENNSHICSLISQDLSEKFISYENRQNISLSSQISQSIYETNQFLIDNKNLTLIEYSVFYGFIKIC